MGVAVSPEMLRQVRLLELRTRGLVNSVFTGEYHSVFKGQGMEFAEVREYQAGDEVRSIDWNVTARMRHPYVKRYIEERELTVMLAVDLSGSQRFGTRVALQERARHRARRGARDERHSQQRSRRHAHVHRSHRARRAAAQGTPARDARHSRSAAARAGGTRHRHRRRHRLSDEDAAESRDRVSPLGLRGSERRATAQAARAATRRGRRDGRGSERARAAGHRTRALRRIRRRGATVEVDTSDPRVRAGL